jgi:hypothetical protein
MEDASGGMTYVHTKFHDDRFRYSSDIEVINSTTWEAEMLVLLIWWGYDYYVKIASRGIQIFMTIGSGIQVILRI